MSGFCYKLVRIQDEKGEKKIKIYDNSKFSDLSICNDKNCTIYLITVEKEYSELDLHKYNLFDIINQNTSYFYTKKNEKKSILQIKDLDSFLFNFLDKKTVCY